MNNNEKKKSFSKIDFSHNHAKLLTIICLKYIFAKKKKKKSRTDMQIKRKTV